MATPLSWESDARGHTRNGSEHEMVQIAVRWSREPAPNTSDAGESFTK